MRAAAPERMFSEMASAHAPSLRTTSWPSGSLPFTATERLLLLKEENWLLPDGRLISPPGGSSLTTSAPKVSQQAGSHGACDHVVDAQDLDALQRRAIGTGRTGPRLRAGRTASGAQTGEDGLGVLARSRRRGCDRARRVDQLHRQPHLGRGAQLRVIHLDEHLVVYRLGVGHGVIRRKYGRVGNVRLLHGLGPLGHGPGGEGAGDYVIDLGPALLGRLGVAGADIQFRHAVSDAQRVYRAVHEAVVDAADLKPPAVGAPEYAVEGPISSGTLLASAPGLQTRTLSFGRVGQYPAHHRGVHVADPSGALTGDKGGDRPLRRQHCGAYARNRVHNVDWPGPEGWLGSQNTGARHDEVVQWRLIPVRAVLSVGGDGATDETGVLLLEPPVVHERLECGGGRIGVDEHIGDPDQGVEVRKGPSVPGH